MIPFLLPVALVIFAFGGVLIMTLLFGYHVVRRDTALVVARKNREPDVMFKGGVFALPGSVQTIDLTPRDYRQSRDVVLDSGAARVDIALELAVRNAADAVLQIREVLGDRASDAAALERFAFDRIDAAVQAAAVPGISFDELSAEAEASIKSSLPAFRVDSLAITRSS
jgi:uncharacterized membrane protein YqiK